MTDTAFPRREIDKPWLLPSSIFITVCFICHGVRTKFATNPSRSFRTILVQRLAGRRGIASFEILGRNVLHVPASCHVIVA